jgi:hypothetical protein
MDMEEYIWMDGYGWMDIAGWIDDTTEKNNILKNV